MHKRKERTHTHTHRKGNVNTTHAYIHNMGVLTIKRMRSGIIKVYYLFSFSASVYIYNVLETLSMFLSLSVCLYLSVCLSASVIHLITLKLVLFTRFSLTSYFNNSQFKSVIIVIIIIICQSTYLLNRV